MKKLIIFAAVASVCLTSFSGPRHHPPMYGPQIHHAPPPPLRHHHHHSGPFWTGLGIGLAGSLLAPVIASPSPAPVVIQAAPPRRVWVPPVYGERPIYRAGIYVGVERYIITPGYWTY